MHTHCRRTRSSQQRNQQPRLRGVDQQDRIRPSDPRSDIRNASARGKITAHDLGVGRESDVIAHAWHHHRDLVAQGSRPQRQTPNVFNQTTETHFRRNDQDPTHQNTVSTAKISERVNARSSLSGR